MIRSVRRKIASSVSEIQPVEDFSFDKWLRIPLQDSFEVGRIYSRLKDTKKINLIIDIPESEKYTEEFKEAAVLPRMIKYFFGEIKNNTIFFMIHVPEQRGIKLQSLDVKSQKIKTRKFQVSTKPAKVVEAKIRLKDPELVSYEMLVEAPVVFDYLSEMVPEVHKIDLLKLDDIISSDSQIEVVSYDFAAFEIPKCKSIAVKQLSKPQKIFKVKVPGIGSFKSTVSNVKIAAFKTPAVKSKKIVQLHKLNIISPDVQISGTVPYKYFDINDTDLTDIPTKIDKSLKNPQSTKELVKLLLKKVQKVEWGKHKELHPQLFKYEEEGAKFLAEHDYALLMDEFGLDKEKQTASALKFLFANRTIRSALIVCSEGRIGDSVLSAEWKNPIGWIGKLNSVAAELSCTEVNGSDDERSDSWIKSSLVHLVSQSTLVNDYHLKILDDKKLNSFDCIVIDEVQMLIDMGEKAHKFLSSIKPSVLWALSSLITKDFQTDLNEHLTNKIEHVKIRQKHDVASNAPDFIWHDDWLYLDDDQRLEYKETLVDCQKDLRKILETGNPYRFQANIFTLLHKVMQVCNFSKVNADSPKIKLLVEQISIIASNRKKVVIFSQYDRMGIRKIEKSLNAAGIKFVIAPNGYSVEEMSKAINMFKQKPEITAFLTDAKISKLRFGDYYVPYIIRFDQWWNPVNMWEIEDLFDFSHRTGRTESINVYTYYTYNTIDQEIKSLLSSKELIHKNIFEAMPVKVFDDLITVEDWLKVFAMPANNEQAPGIKLDVAVSILKNSTLNYFRTALSKFFFVLGYKNVDVIEEPGTSSFNLVGESKRNNRKFYLYARVFLDELVSKKAVKDIMFDAADSTSSKIFIITKGRFEDGIEEFKQKNYIMLDLMDFTNLLVKFNLINESDANQTDNK